MDPIRIAIAGAGRMGKAILSTIAPHEDLRPASLWVRDSGQADGLDLPTDILVSTTMDEVAAAADVVLDFSLAAATDTVLDAATRLGKPLVCGVSGLSETQFEALDQAARSIAIVYDRNMSLGITVLEKLARQASAALGEAFDVEVHEVHHVHKLDSPSGTALKLGEAIASARGIAPGAIRYEVERRGEVPGEHTVVLSSPTERLTLGHSVTTRQVFADGALRAARWIAGKPPGRYSMQDVLGLT